MHTIYSRGGIREQDESLMQAGEGYKIHTSEYEAQTVVGPYQDFSEMIVKALEGRSISERENAVQIEDARYPNNIAGKVRQEALTSIGYRKDDNSFTYVTRKRPQQERSNTPSAEDAGIILHGIDNGSVISPRRFIADAHGKLKDDEVSSEQVQQFFAMYGNLFEGYELITLGHLILACGNIARKEGVPTSGLMQANIILLTERQVKKILDLNRKTGNNNYTLRNASDTSPLLNPENGEHVPKLEAYRELLRRKTIS